MNAFNDRAYVDNVVKTIDAAFDSRALSAADDWPDWQRRFRAALADASGLTHIRECNRSLPLECRLEETMETETYFREKRYVLTEPGIEIPFYLLLPKRRTGPVPLVLCPHGHNRRGKELYVGNATTGQESEQMLEGERDIALQAVEHGCAAIAPDVRGFWEMARKQEMDAGKTNSCEELQRRSLLFGRSLIGERVYDMGRLIDYAATRAEMDGQRIMITGNSGGGTVSLFTAALDPRIGIAAPGSYFCTFDASIASIHHCICNVVPGVRRLGEMYDVAGLIAPRPVIMINGREDPIFPIHATREAFGHLRRIYAAFGAADRCALFEGDGGHRYYKSGVWPFVREQWR